jgi:protein TonB
LNFLEILMHKFALRRFEAGFASLALHAVGIALLFTLTASDTARNGVREAVRIVLPPDLLRYTAPPGSRSGGGGGERSPLPASKGRLPRAATRQFTPPLARVYNQSPMLTIEPTLVVASGLKLPQIDLPNYGDPLGRVGPPSGGPGSGGGIGSGGGGGVGSGDGPGVGPGRGGGVRSISVGGRRSPAAVISKIEPDYSDEARKARLQGIVVLQLEVDERGMPRNVIVVRPLGLGLDERAVEAVSKWRFRPAYRDGRPYVSTALVEVHFHLL